MPNIRDAIIPWKTWGEMLRPQRYRRGLLGDGQGHVQVTNKPGWSWIRYDYDSHRLSIVRNPFNMQMVDGVPVLVGKKDPGDEYEQVLFVDVSWYVNPSQETLDQYTSTAHGVTHAGKNNDPAPIDLNNLTPGKVVPSSGLIVTVYDFVYVYNCSVVHFGQANIDLSGDRPALYGHCYVLVYLDPSTGGLDSVTSDVVAADTNPSYPTVPTGMIPLAIIELGSWTNTITDDDIWQYKILYDSACGSGVSTHNHSSDTEGGASLLGVEELTVNCWEDLVIDAGQVSPTQAYHRLVAPAGMYIDGDVVEIALHTIYADATWGCGQIIILSSVSPALYVDYRITLQHNVGNLWLNGGVDVVLGEGDHIMLIYDGTYWHDL